MHPVYEVSKRYLILCKSSIPATWYLVKTANKGNVKAKFSFCPAHYHSTLVTQQE